MSTDKNIKKPPTKVESTAQPHFIPGYTGFCPDLGSAVGSSYARVTREILKDRPEIAARLQPLDAKVANPLKIDEFRLKQMEKDKKLINSRCPSVGRKVFNDGMIPGYCGHVPNNKETVGISYSRGYVKSISKFIREQRQDGASKSL